LKLLPLRISGYSIYHLQEKEKEQTQPFLNSDDQEAI
jgi:hypothetical protein